MTRSASMFFRVSANVAAAADATQREREDVAVRIQRGLDPHVADCGVVTATHDLEVVVHLGRACERIVRVEQRAELRLSLEREGRQGVVGELQVHPRLSLAARKVTKAPVSFVKARATVELCVVAPAGTDET